jgi:hypothetical protein
VVDAGAAGEHDLRRRIGSQGARLDAAKTVVKGVGVRFLGVTKRARIHGVRYLSGHSLACLVKPLASSVRCSVA